MSWFEIPFGVKSVNPLPVDARRWNTSNEPYASTAEVLAQNPPAIRIVNQEYDVYNEFGTVDIWYFMDGIADEDLVRMDFADVETFIRTTGDQTKTGTLTVEVLKTGKATPDEANDTVPFAYANSNYVNKTGDSIVNGQVTFNNARITQATPSNDQDLVPFKYLQDNYQLGIRTLPWAEIVAIKTAGNMHVGQAYIVSDQDNEEILIDGKSPDGSFFFKRTGDDGVQTIFKVE